MPRKLALFVTSCIVIVGGVLAAQIVTEQDESTKVEQPKESAPLDADPPATFVEGQPVPEGLLPQDPVTKDILNQRKNQNSSIFEGTILEGDGSDEQEFAEQLQRIAANPEAFGIEPSERVYFERDPAADFISALRNASEALDVRAHELECQRDYEGADRLRKLGKRIRLEARAADDDVSVEPTLPKVSR